ncbi:hypothetical protein P2B03_13055, partial [Xanthomonas perforans]
TQVADLRFGPPYNCALELRAQPDGYALLSRNGGKFCEALTGGGAPLQIAEGGAHGGRAPLSGAG